MPLSYTWYPVIAKVSKDVAGKFADPPSIRINGNLVLLESIVTKHHGIELPHLCRILFTTVLGTWDSNHQLRVKKFVFNQAWWRVCRTGGVRGRLPHPTKSNTSTQTSAVSTSTWWFIEIAFLSDVAPNRMTMWMKFRPLVGHWNLLYFISSSHVYLSLLALRWSYDILWYWRLTLKCWLVSWREHQQHWAISTKTHAPEKLDGCPLMPPILKPSHPRHQWGSHCRCQPPCCYNSTCLLPLVVRANSFGVGHAKQNLSWFLIQWPTLWHQRFRV